MVSIQLIPPDQRNALASPDSATVSPDIWDNYLRANPHGSLIEQVARDNFTHLGYESLRLSHSNDKLLATEIHPRNFKDTQCDVPNPVKAAIDQAYQLSHRSYLDPQNTTILTAQGLLRAHFGDHARVFFVPTGTRANLIALECVTSPNDIILCASTSHLVTNEGAAPSNIHGRMILPIEPDTEGKITVDAIHNFFKRRLSAGFPHGGSIGAISISNPTELGAIYSTDELNALARYCYASGAILQLDGARLFHASASLEQNDLSSLSSRQGVSVITLDANKLGGDGAAIVFTGGFIEQSKSGALIPVERKSAQEMIAFLESKEAIDPKAFRFAASFSALLTGHLGFNLAQQANLAAQQLGREFQNLGYELLCPVSTNAVFVKLAPKTISGLIENGFEFAVFNQPQGICRFVTTWNKSVTDCQELVNFCQKNKK